MAFSVDYAKMIEAQIMLGEPMAFDQLMQTCDEIENSTNRAAAQ